MFREKFYAIDAHCHVYPDAIAAKAARATCRFYDFDDPANDGTIGRLLAIAEESGIDGFVIQSVATTPHQVEDINRFIAASVAAHPGVLYGLGTLHPDCADMAAEVRLIVSLGLHGVKLHPDIQRVALDDDRCRRIFRLCADEGLPVLLHTGDRRYDYSNPNRLIPILREFPDLQVVGAHFGGFSVWEEATAALADFGNLSVDCSSSLGFLSADKARQLVGRYGAARVMFGSDYPLWQPQHEAELLCGLRLSDADTAAIFSENAKRVYHLQ